MGALDARLLSVYPVLPFVVVEDAPRVSLPFFDEPPEPSQVFSLTNSYTEMLDYPFLSSGKSRNNAWARAIQCAKATVRRRAHNKQARRSRAKNRKS